MYQPHQLNRSSLVLLLQQWARAQAQAQTKAVQAQAVQAQAVQVQARSGGPHQQDMPEQLSQWLSTVDAVKLSRALHVLESSAPSPTSRGWDAGGEHVRSLQADLQAARLELTGLVTAKAAPSKPLRERADNTPLDGPDPAADADFSIHAARYLATQKQMDARLAALRARMRQVLSAGSGKLRRLAALDAVMEQMLGAREQRLWASLPGHLERRMAHLRAAHQQQLEATGLDDAPQRWSLPGGWLFTFEQDLRALLLAELQVRLQPLTGLLEAAQNHELLPWGMPPPPTRPSTPAQAMNPVNPEQITGMIE